MKIVQFQVTPKIEDQNSITRETMYILLENGEIWGTHEPYKDNNIWDKIDTSQFTLFATSY